MLLGIEGLDNYEDLRYLLIKLVEGTHGGTPYLDTVGQATIGVGFNIEGNGRLRELVFTYFNISEVEVDESGNFYRDRLSTVIETVSSTTALQDGLNAIMNERWLANGMPADMPNTFIMSVEDAVMRPIFDVAILPYEVALDTFLTGSGGNFGNSFERLALISLMWNDSPASDQRLLGVGNSLSNALRDGNRADAWYEIRFNSGGPYNRRYAESQLFGLYNNPGSVGDVEAEQVASMYLDKLTDMGPTESFFVVRDANYYLTTLQVGMRVDTLGQILKPIANYILQNYTSDEVKALGYSGAAFNGDVVLGFETKHSADAELFLQPVYRAIYDKSPQNASNLPVGVTGINDLLIGIDGKSYTMQGLYGDDLIIGADMADTLYGGYKINVNRGFSGNDTLVGGGGNDGLYGQDGDDFLLGGAGHDTYYFENNFGFDIIKDSDGDGSISIAGWTGNFSAALGSDIIFRDDANNFEVIKINNGTTTDLLVTPLTAAVQGNILIKNWEPGHLGISLEPAPVTPAPGNVGRVIGNGANNAITLDNLRDEDLSIDIANFTALYAEGGVGDDIIMGMLQGNDTLLGGEGNDIISGGFTSTLASNAYNFFLPFAPVPGIDSIDGGAGEDFIFASAGGSIAHGGSDNDVLLSSGPAYFKFNNLEEVKDKETYGVAGHIELTRDDIYADALTQMKFGVEKIGQTHTINHKFYTDFTSSYAEYASLTENVKYIGKSGSESSSYSGGDVSYAFEGSYTLTYDYSDAEQLTPFDAGNPSAVSMVVSTFTPGVGHTLEDFASIKGANLFGDEGNDYLGGGIYADYLSGGVGNDTVFAGA